MAISFPHSTRVLRNDGMAPTAAALAAAGLILALWGAWFVFARVPVTVTCDHAEVISDNEIVAHCPPEQAGRLRRGAPAIAIVTGAAGRQILKAVVLGQPAGSSRGMDRATVEIYPLARTPLNGSATIEVRIDVEELSPLELVMRSGAAQP